MPDNPFRDELARRTGATPASNPFRTEIKRRSEIPSASTVASKLAVTGIINSALAAPSASGDLLAAASAGVQRFNPYGPRGRPSFGELYQAEQEKFPASALRAIPRPTYGDVSSAVQSIPALVPGGESPGDAYARNRQEFDADEMAMRGAHPRAAAIGDIGGDIGSLLIGRKATGAGDAIQRFESRVAGRASPQAAKSMLDDLQGVLTSTPMQKLARGAGRSVESGVEAAVLNIVKDPESDPLEMAALAAGGQMVGSGFLAGSQGLVSGGPLQAGLKMSILAASSFGLVQVLKSATPGGEDRILESIETGYDKVALALGLGAASAALAATRYGRGNTNFSDQTRTFLDGVATAHRGTTLSLLTDWTEGDQEDRDEIERVLTAISSNPNYQGETAAERRIVNEIRAGSGLQRYTTGGGF